MPIFCDVCVTHCVEWIFNKIADLFDCWNSLQISLERLKCPWTTLDRVTLSQTRTRRDIQIKILFSSFFNLIGQSFAAFDSQLRFMPRVSRSAYYRRKEWCRVYWFNRGSFVCGESEFIRDFIFVILDFKTSRSSSFKQFSCRIKCVFIQRHSRTFNPKSQCELKWTSGPPILVCL